MFTSYLFRKRQSFSCEFSSARNFVLNRLSKELLCRHLVKELANDGDLDLGSMLWVYQ